MDELLQADEWGEVEAPIDPLEADFADEDADLGDAGSKGPACMKTGGTF